MLFKNSLYYILFRYNNSKCVIKTTNNNSFMIAVYFTYRVTEMTTVLTQLLSDWITYNRINVIQSDLNKPSLEGVKKKM